MNIVPDGMERKPFNGLSIREKEKIEELFDELSDFVQEECWVNDIVAAMDCIESVGYSDSLWLFGQPFFQQIKKQDPSDTKLFKQRMLDVLQNELNEISNESLSIDNVSAITFIWTVNPYAGGLALLAKILQMVFTSYNFDLTRLPKDEYDVLLANEEIRAYNVQEFQKHFLPAYTVVKKMISNPIDKLFTNNELELMLTDMGYDYDEFGRFIPVRNKIEKQTLKDLGWTNETVSTVGKQLSHATPDIVRANKATRVRMEQIKKASEERLKEINKKSTKKTLQLTRSVGIVCTKELTTCVRQFIRILNKSDWIKTNKDRIKT